MLQKYKKSKTCHICYDENINVNCNTCECKKGITVCNVCWNNIEHDNILCPLCKTPIRTNTKKCNCNNKITIIKLFKYVLLVIGYFIIPYLFSYILFLLYCGPNCNIIRYYNEDVYRQIWFLLWNWLVGVLIIAIIICIYNSYNYENINSFIFTGEFLISIIIIISYLIIKFVFFKI